MNDHIKKILSNVQDPEVPVLSVIDLGIVRDAVETAEGIEVTITPTYTGCPAMDLIATQIRMEMLAQGYPTVTVKTVLSPAWTTDWMTEEGKQKLKAYGIAPPLHSQQVCATERFSDEVIQCPLCNSFHTHKISNFGSTACKALYQCDDCKEPFDYFKCH